MLLPIADDNSDRKITPYINYFLIAANILVFVFFQQLGSNELFTYAWSTVPAEILTGVDQVRPPLLLNIPETGQQFVRPALYETPGSVYLTLFTSMFMHGGFAHLGGNMLYLWIFGDNIENKLGHLPYLLFYLSAGLIAALSHVFSTYFMAQDPFIPSLGASGAISGVLGAYLILFPQRKVHAIFVWFIVTVPALVALGVWIAFQIINGIGLFSDKSDGVAYAAHIGGFVAGILLIKFFSPKEETADVFKQPFIQRYHRRK
ncbi:rhomboid family intramembrane serine protease [Lacibacter luteus]|uniref:Rhomboid family intramembrane serine protease n=1 Tax=Lacibacter luteus TaxID=2508719 RepID=A0A4Q1CE37_9BACT|nr:rhomboid family intramembrane serine protease [Lacibacter luteus]RXK57722.1 rhomboid family intramembrane serine protease [Lacibacter luteus]